MMKLSDVGSARTVIGKGALDIKPKPTHVVVEQEGKLETRGKRRSLLVVVVGVSIHPH